MLTRWAFRILKRIYRPGYAYHKAGIMLLNLAPISQSQPSFFTAGAEEGARPQALMQVLDEVNGRYGRRTLQFASEGIARSWTVSARQTHLAHELQCVAASARFYRCGRNSSIRLCG